MTIHNMPTARTVSNAKLQGLVRCECHSMIKCPSLDTLARLHEANYDDPVSEIETRLTLREIGWLVVAGVVLSVIALVLAK
jgi:hypothetical protein